MLFYVAVAAGLTFCVLLFRHLMRMGRHVISMVFCAVLTVVPGWFAWQTRALELELAGAVQHVSGVHDADVDCQGFLREFRLDNNLGEVRFGRDGTVSHTAGLRDSVCDNLRAWLDSDKNDPTRDQMIAVHVLTHEAIHVSGVIDERSTECQAMQADAETAIHLGATPEQAQALAERYYTEIYPHMPSGYHSNLCHEDGEYDLTPGDGVWP